MFMGTAEVLVSIVTMDYGLLDRGTVCPETAGRGQCVQVSRDRAAHRRRELPTVRASWDRARPVHARRASVLRRRTSVPYPWRGETPAWRGGASCTHVPAVARPAARDSRRGPERT